MTLLQIARNHLDSSGLPIKLYEKTEWLIGERFKDKLLSELGLPGGTTSGYLLGISFRFVKDAGYGITSIGYLSTSEKY